MQVVIDHQTKALVLPLAPEFPVTDGQPHFVFDEADRVQFEKRQRDHAIEDMDKANQWQAIYEAWLAGGWRSHGKAISAQTRRAYSYSLAEFQTFAFEHCPELIYLDRDGNRRVRFWRVLGSEIVDWQNSMRVAGLKEATINLRLAGLSSLWKFLKKRPYINRLTGEQTTFVTSNPVEVPERSKIEPFKSEKATFLTFDEFMALLHRIDRTRVQGLRDYALIVTLFLTGQRSSAIGELRWGDIKHPKEAKDVVYYTWASKAKEGTDELLREAYEAICVYLQAAGRLDAMGKDDYIFQPLSDVGTRLAQRKAEKAGRTLAAMTGSTHLTGARINQIIKRAARRAGLDETLVHTHITRHSAAVWMSENGVDLLEIQRTLHHSSPNTTMIYLRGMKRERHPMWKSVGQFFNME